jgi:hypothetical protein
VGETLSSFPHGYCLLETRPQHQTILTETGGVGETYTGEVSTSNGIWRSGRKSNAAGDPKHPDRSGIRIPF